MYGAVYKMYDVFTPFRVSHRLELYGWQMAPMSKSRIESKR